MKEILFIILMAMTVNSFSQNHDIIHLWPGKVPGEKTEKLPPVIEAGKDNILRYNEVSNPAFEVWLPEKEKANKSAVIICPGGGYGILAWDLEGTEIASWLNRQGFTAFVLQYRVPDKKAGALQDVQRAIRMIRSDASKWNLDPEKIGVMGFSAGGSLSARASTNFNMSSYAAVDKADSLSCRPSFALLIYPAYLDEGPDNTLTPELHLTKDVPPVFLFQTADDPYGNSSIVMTAALRKAGVPVEFHLLPSGGHGYGLRKGNRAAETWTSLAEKWLGSTLILNRQ